MNRWQKYILIVTLIATLTLLLFPPWQAYSHKPLLIVARGHAPFFQAPLLNPWEASYDEGPYIYQIAVTRLVLELGIIAIAGAILIVGVGLLKVQTWKKMAAGALPQFRKAMSREERHRILPTEIVLHQMSHTLGINFDDGHSFNLPFEYLRVYSPSDCGEDHRKPRVIDKDEVNIIEIEPSGSHSVRLDFDDGHSDIYTWKLLYSLGVHQVSLWGAYMDLLARSGVVRNTELSRTAMKTEAVLFPTTKGGSFLSRRIPSIDTIPMALGFMSFFGLVKDIVWPKEYLRWSLIVNSVASLLGAAVVLYILWWGRAKIDVHITSNTRRRLANVCLYIVVSTIFFILYVSTISGK